MRTAVVTGAGSGLGRAIAAELIGRGYRVHVTDVDAAAASGRRCSRTSSTIPMLPPSFSGRLLTAGGVAKEVGKLTERPRPILIVPRRRGPMLRFFDHFPSLGLRMLPLVMWDARRKRRAYKKKIEAGKWP